MSGTTAAAAATTSSASTSTPTVTLTPDEQRILHVLTQFLDIPADANFHNQPIVQALRHAGITHFNRDFICLSEDDIWDLRAPAPTAGDPPEIPKIHYRKLIITLSLFHHGSRESKQRIDIRKVSKARFDSYKTDTFRSKLEIIPWNVPLPNTHLSSHEDQWKRTIKPNKSDYKELKDVAYWLTWKEQFESTIKGHGLYHLIQEDYEVPITLSVQDGLQRDWMYSIFVDKLLEPAVKKIVKSHIRDHDTRAIWKEITDYCTNCPTTLNRSRQLSTYITSTRLKNISWKGSQTDFIWFFKEKVRQHGEISGSPFSDSQAIDFAEAAITGIPHLECVRITEQAARRGGGGAIPALTFDEYMSLLAQAAQQHDQSQLVFSNNRNRRSANVHAILDEDEEDLHGYDDDEDGYQVDNHEYSLDEETLMVYQVDAQGRTRRVLMPLSVWKNVSDEGKKIWDKMSEKDKSIILGDRAGSNDRSNRTNSNNNRTGNRNNRFGSNQDNRNRNMLNPSLTRSANVHQTTNDDVDLIDPHDDQDYLQANTADTHGNTDTNNQQPITVAKVMSNNKPKNNQRNVMNVRWQSDDEEDDYHDWTERPDTTPTGHSDVQYSVNMASRWDKYAMSDDEDEPNKPTDAWNATLLAMDPEDDEVATEIDHKYAAIFQTPDKQRNKGSRRPPLNTTKAELMAAPIKVKSASAKQAFNQQASELAKLSTRLEISGEPTLAQLVQQPISTDISDGYVNTPRDSDIDADKDDADKIDAKTDSRSRTRSKIDSRSRTNTRDTTEPAPEPDVTHEADQQANVPRYDSEEYYRLYRGIPDDQDIDDHPATTGDDDYYESGQFQKDHFGNDQSTTAPSQGPNEEESIGDDTPQPDTNEDPDDDRKQPAVTLGQVFEDSDDEDLPDLQALTTKIYGPNVTLQQVDPPHPSDDLPIEDEDGNPVTPTKKSYAAVVSTPKRETMSGRFRNVPKPDPPFTERIVYDENQDKRIILPPDQPIPPELANQDKPDISESDEAKARRKQRQTQQRQRQSRRDSAMTQPRATRSRTKMEQEQQEEIAAQARAHATKRTPQESPKKKQQKKKSKNPKDNFCALLSPGAKQQSSSSSSDNSTGTTSKDPRSKNRFQALASSDDEEDFS